jgi:quercetin dioxygenase-like cupin family protein
MRFVTVGRNTDERSYVADVRELLSERKADDAPALDRLWSTKEYPPEFPVLRRRADEHARVMSSDLTTQWVVAAYEPDGALGMHCTDTLDYVTVVAGSVTLHLEDGEIELRVGDSVMLPGLMHGWTAGPDGCVVNAVVLPAR